MGEVLGLFCFIQVIAPGQGPTGQGHRAFLPIVRPSPPEVRNAAGVRTDVDRFIERALEEKGLSLGPEASRAELIRRVSFGLAGLPPGPLEIAAFLSDPAPGAHERMVERCLASPHYGERWGRHWLDAAGYADSNGYFSADSDRPLAWRYRDYVVRSLNADKPLDRFVEEQLAGDEIAGYQPDGDLLPEAAELLTATHFLRNAQDGTGESDGNDMEVLADRMAVLDGTVQIVASSLLGLTLQCARCHDHKFDPLTQVEYYGLRAVFAGAYNPERWLKPEERVVTAGARAEREAYREKKERVDSEVKVLRESLEGAAVPLRKQLIAERISALPEPERSAVRKAHETPKEKRSAEEKALLEKHDGLLKVSEDQLAGRFGEFAELRKGIQAAIVAREKQLPAPPPKIAALFETGPEPPPHRLLVRGLLTEPGPETPPGVPAVLTSAVNLYRPAPPPGGKSSGRRLALARWITSRDNPLFARVMANRIWQHHFGTGIVSTSDNLGRNGAPPTHPELLDYLAHELVRGGFRMKALHRLILRSGAYRQSGARQENGGRREDGRREDGQPVDPENRLLHRFPIQRLDAESLRDAMLAASGELDRRLEGAPVPTRHAADGQVVVDEKVEGAFRRSLYLKQRRTQPLSLLETFDAPLIVTGCSRRSPSTTALQSLALLNSDFVLARARALSARTSREAGPGREHRLAHAFLLSLGRGPGAEERAAAERFFEEAAASHGPEDSERAWADFCHTLLSSNAFLYVD